MSDAWSPALSLRESGGRCHLTLDGLTYGVGFSLQEAADDLIARLVGLALGVCAGGFDHERELGPPDLDLMDFLSELAEFAARGEDIRPRVFG